MIVDVVLTYQQIDAHSVKEKGCVVIDTLRATSTVITALNAGCAEIVPAFSPEEAFFLSKKPSYKGYLLGGEVEGQQVHRFQMGNSPLEYTRRNVAGKGIIFMTTNGTKTLQKVQKGRFVILCALLNAGTAAKWLAKKDEAQVLICCAGTRGCFSLEDFITAGLLVHELSKQKSHLVISDLAYTASALYQWVKRKKDPQKGIFELLKTSENGRRLVKCGHEDDILHCSRENVFTTIPHYCGNSIKSLPGDSCITLPKKTR